MKTYSKNEVKKIWFEKNCGAIRQFCNCISLKTDPPPPKKKNKLWLWEQTLNGLKNECHLENNI